MPSKKLAFINGRPQLVDANARVRSDADRQYNRVRNEQQSDYLKFYHSNEWKQLREQILIRDNSLCQHCGLQASLVDHIVPSEDDWEDRTNADNLQALCRDCHYWKTRRETTKRKKGQHRAMKITVIVGYPASGKSTYVKRHQGQHDLVYDYDHLMTALTGLPLHQGNIDANDYVQLIYELILRKLKAEQTFDHVWLVMTYPDDKLDTLLASRDVEHILIDTDRDTCMQRLSKQGRDVSQLIKAMNKLDELKSQNKFKKFKEIKN